MLLTFVWWPVCNLGIWAHSFLMLNLSCTGKKSLSQNPETWIQIACLCLPQTWFWTTRSYIHHWEMSSERKCVEHCWGSTTTRTRRSWLIACRSYAPLLTWVDGRRSSTWTRMVRQIRQLWYRPLLQWFQDTSEGLKKQSLVELVTTCWHTICKLQEGVLSRYHFVLRGCKS